jgi:hypothetical protein
MKKFGLADNLDYDDYDLKTVILTNEWRAMWYLNFNIDKKNPDKDKNTSKEIMLITKQSCLRFHL